MRASSIMQSRVMKNPKIQIVWQTVPIEVIGDNKLLQVVRTKNTATNEESEFELNGLFYAIGHKPNTDIFENTALLCDHDGYILTEKGTTLTNIPGVFAAGDVQDKKYRQAITAAGTGCMAALDAEKYLSSFE
jgi:thioredoxin reductase (NADPH)